VIGRGIKLDGETYQIVGIMPRGFIFILWRWRSSTKPPATIPAQPAISPDGHAARSAFLEPGGYLLSWRRMGRGIHVAVVLLAVFLLVRPFDCFSSGKFDQKAADCCNKGNCSPSNPDDCCKATVQGGNHLLTSKAADHSSPLLAVAMADAPDTTLPLLVAFLFVELHPPPGSLPDSRLNLPLLI
jgi:hypothetical protein